MLRGLTNLAVSEEHRKDRTMKVILLNVTTGSELTLDAENHPNLTGAIQDAIREFLGDLSDAAPAAGGNAKKRGRPPGSKSAPQAPLIPEATPAANNATPNDGLDLRTI